MPELIKDRESDSGASCDGKKHKREHDNDFVDIYAVLEISPDASKA